MKCSTLIFALIALICLAGFPLVGRLDVASTNENGVVENVQVVILMAAFIAYGLQAYWSAGILRTLLSTGAVLSLFGAFREIDIRQMNVPGWVEWVGQGIGRDLVLAGLALLLLALAVRSLLLLKGRVREVASSCFGKAGATILTLLVISDIFEKKWIALEWPQLYEELGELLAYSLIFVVALTARHLGIPDLVAEEVPAENVK